MNTETPRTCVAALDDLRDEIDTARLKSGAMIKALGLNALPPEADRGEMIANVKLAYRHLEDARMRLGKAIQAHEGGESVHDRKVS